jgi:hypothetical protein
MEVTTVVPLTLDGVLQGDGDASDDRRNGFERARQWRSDPVTTGDDLQMQYLVSVIDDKTNPGSTDREPAISAFNERLIAEGYWVFAGGLADTEAATVVDNRGEEAVFSDGPFVESKEYLAGVWVWEAPDLDVALKLAAEASKVCDRKIEVRPFQ